MSMQEHVESLRSKHQHLEQLIDDELLRPMPDQSELTRLKKQKLLVKEEIERAAISHVRQSEHRVSVN